MPNLVSVAAETTDVQIRGPRAPAQYGPAASYHYRGNIASLSPERVAEMFATMFINWDNYRKVFLPEILEAYAQYNGETTQPGKEPWQSDFHVPLPAQAVDTAVLGPHRPKWIDTLPGAALAIIFGMTNGLILCGPPSR